MNKFNRKRSGAQLEADLVPEAAALARQNDTIFNEREEADVLYTNESKPDFLYDNMTLDEIIQLKRREKGVSGANLGQAGVVYGTDDTRRFILSPIMLLQILSEDSKLFEMEAKELEVGVTGEADFRAHRWRVTWTHVGIVGIAEAPRKMMAKQVAAYDLIEKMKGEFPSYNLPECQIPEGVLVNPFLFQLLENQRQVVRFGSPDFELKASVNAAGRKEFTSICFVGDHIFVGKSLDPVYAKRFAVRKAYECLHGTGTKYPDDRIIRGNMCYRDLDESYEAVESEATHVYVCYKKPAKRVRMASQVSRSGSVASLSDASVTTVVFRPPRLRPPPVVVPPGLNIKLQYTGTDADDRAGGFFFPHRVPATDEEMLTDEDASDSTGEEEMEDSEDDPDPIEVEPPEKYDEYSDDDAEELPGEMVDESEEETPMTDDQKRAAMFKKKPEEAGKKEDEKEEEDEEEEEHEEEDW